MALSRRVRRTLTWTVPTTGALAGISVFAVTGILGVHHDASSRAGLVSASPGMAQPSTETPAPTETAAPSGTPSPAPAQTAPASSPVSSSTAPTPAELDLHSVDWKDVTLPGDTCFSDSPIQLHDGQAILPGTPHDRAVTLAQLWSPSGTTYGKLGDSAAENAAVIEDCSYAHGTAASTLRDGVVVFSGAGGTLHVLGTLFPLIQPQGMHATGIADVAVADGQVSFTEVFYGPHDIDANGTGRATTVYTWTGSGFTSRTTITQQPATAPPTAGG